MTANNKSKQRVVSAREVFSHPVHFLAFGFGSGLSPKAPGTAGTLAAVPIYLILANSPLLVYLLATLLLCLVGIWICDRSSELLGVHDHGGIVWDEFAGYLITMIAAPSGWIWVVIGFALFRFFDVIKPWPIGWLDRRVGGGFGIMVDDIIAGFFALALMQGLALSGWVG
ncbi:MAG: phosphatidylglycerophosphatase A family protein [bacterium]